MRPTLIALLDRSGLSWLGAWVPTSGAVYVAVALIAGALFCRRARASGLDVARAVDIWILGGLSGAVGARVFYLLIHVGSPRPPAHGWLDLTGTASWGAYLGIALVVGTYAVVRRLPPWVWLDLAASVQPVGEAIGRWACWLAGDDFGRVTHVPWAIQFPAGSLASNAHVARGLIGPDAAWSLPVHPEQFYLMANALVLSIIIAAVWRRMRDRPGFTLAGFLVLYGASRFDWEFFRDPAAGGASAGLSVSQWMCVAYVAVGCLLLALRRRPEPAARA